MNIPIMRGSRGLFTQDDSVRSSYSNSQSPSVGKMGLVELSGCLNVDISDRNRVSRRRAISNKIALNSHSLHPVGNRYCLFVSGENLNLLLPSLTEFITIAQVTEGMRVSCYVLDEVAYWCNGVQIGKVVDGENRPWVRPDVVYGNKTRVFLDPPAGRLVGYFNGRFYMAVGKAVYYSEPYGPDLWAPGDSFLSFETEVTMVRGVHGGLFVSDSEQTWFLGGDGPAEFAWKVVDNSPALPYSDSRAVGSMQAMPDGSFSWIQGGKKESAFWLTGRGVVYGGGDGEAINITDERIDIPGPGHSAGSILVDGKQIVASFV